MPSAGCGFRKETVAGTRRKERDAPTADRGGLKRGRQSRVPSAVEQRHCLGASTQAPPVATPIFDLLTGLPALRPEVRGRADAKHLAVLSCSVASAGIGATLPQCHAARIIIRHPFNRASHPQHHRRLTLSNDLAYDENPAAAVGTAHSNFGQRESRKTRCRSPHPRR